MGNGNGQSWRNVDTNLRMDIPVENLVGIAFLGLDGVEYSGSPVAAQRSGLAFTPVAAFKRYWAAAFGSAAI